MTSSTWFPLAQLLRPQGRRGELLADPLTNIADAFQAGLEVWLARAGEPSGESSPVVLESHWAPTGRNAARVVLKLSCAGTISEAEALEGQTVFLPASKAPKLEEGTWFVGDLLGCTVFDAEQPVGEVTDVEYAVAPDGRTLLDDAAPLLVVMTPAGTEAMIPLIRAWIDEVDTAAKTIRMRLPEGLIAPDVEE